MTDCTSNNLELSNKRLVLVQRIGPAFSPRDIEQSHQLLDETGVPREGSDGHTYSLPERVAYLCGWKNELRRLTAIRIEPHISIP